MSSSNNHDYAAFVMTFNRPEVVVSTIIKIFEQSLPPKVLLVIDNANCAETKLKVESLECSNFEYIGLPENTGPAGAAHYALNELVNRGYNWIYWGDDDDPPKYKDTLERLLSIANSNKFQRIGAVGEVGQRFDWEKGVINRLADSELKGIVNVDVIAGGQQLLINSKAIKEVGLPKKELFFGWEEPELCFRMRKAEYTLLVDGERMKDARISAGRFGVVVNPSSIDRPYNSLWRNYYSTRNYIYIMRNSFGRNDLALKQMLKTLVKSILSFKRGFRYGIKFSSMALKGVLHGCFSKMGKVVEPGTK